MDKSLKMFTKIYDPDLGLMGYLAIDSMIDHVACGGIRVKTVNNGVHAQHILEVKELAKEMTLKFGFHNITQGGAKAVILLPSHLNQQQRDQYFYAFGQQLASFLRKGTLKTGQDMGMTGRDLYFIERGSGLGSEREIPSSDKRTDSGEFTAIGIAAVFDSVVEHNNLNNDQLRCCIEGFGDVGSHLAQELMRRNAKIVGVSTLSGSLYHPEGLNIKKLLSLQKEHGDRLIYHYPNAQTLKKEDILTQPVDVLFPCAGFHTIDENNADLIKARMIVSGANCSASEEAICLLYGKGTMFIPGFVANAGSVYKNFLRKEKNIYKPHLIKKEIANAFSQSTKKLLNEAKIDNKNFYDIAVLVANRNIKRMQLQKTYIFQRFRRKIDSMVKRGELVQ